MTYVFHKIPEIDYLYCRNSFVALTDIAKEHVLIDGSAEEKIQLLLFLQAISQVNESYLEYNIDVISSKGEESQSKPESLKELHLERTFAYELYRHWQNLLCLSKSNLRVDAEIGKKIGNVGNIEELRSLKCDSIEPDLVLHESQGHMGNHNIACEIKRNLHLDKTKIGNDIKKLCKYMSPRIWGEHPYQYGVFIVVNRNFKWLKKKLHKLKEEEHFMSEIMSINHSHLLCMTYDKNNIGSVEYDTLNNILEL